MLRNILLKFAQGVGVPVGKLRNILVNLLGYRLLILLNSATEGVEPIITTVKTCNGRAFKIQGTLWLTFVRAKTFDRKEPDTIWWLDSMAAECTRLDIGGNMGLFSIYHSKFIRGSTLFSRTV